jgi:hypothetical protein
MGCQAGTLMISFPSALLFLALSPLAPADAGVKIEVSRDAIDFRIGPDLVTRYHIGTAVAKPYFWPVNGPGGVPLTRAWPMEKAGAGGTTDHVHQKSAWFCHGDVIPDGVELKQKVKGVEGVDFWSEAVGHGRIVCVQVGDPRGDKAHGAITTHNEWQTADGICILEESRTVHLVDLGAGRLIVLDIDFHAARGAVTFGDTKEGAFGVRVRDDLTEAKGKGHLENAEGKKGERQVWGERSRWCDYSGPLDQGTLGIAILDDTANPSPACWHSRGYGLMAANPFGRGASGFPAVRARTDLVKLAKGDHLKLRYGLLLHSGDAKDGKVEEAYEKFVKLGK